MRNRTFFHVFFFLNDFWTFYSKLTRDFLVIGFNIVEIGSKYEVMSRPHQCLGLGVVTLKLDGRVAAKDRPKSKEKEDD